MNEFKKFHPIVNFLYFAIVIVFSCFFMHPIALVISLFSAFLYSVILKGRKFIKTNLLYMIPMLIFMSLINPLFNHEGMTILAYFPNGNPLTFESVIYGAFATIMILSVICWFSCFNEIMTSDKLIYLFGKIAPTFSLIFSMTLRFVPRFLRQTRLTVSAQKMIGHSVFEGSMINRFKSASSILSSMLTWSFESAINTADSMRSRGYGTTKRTFFSIYKMSYRDIVAILLLAFCSIYIIVGNYFGGFYFNYFPQIMWNKMTPYSISVFIVYLVLGLLPVIIEVWEVIKWKFIKSKI